MENVTYTKSNWEQEPSKNTPFYANRFNNMDNGINNCADRANGSIPYDNILDYEDAEAVTQRDLYVMDAIEMKDFANRIGDNTITQSKTSATSLGENYTIKNQAATSRVPLGAFTMTKIADITPQFSGTSIITSSITFDASNLANYQNLRSTDFYFFATSVTSYVQTGGVNTGASHLGRDAVTYNNLTGIGVVNGLHTFKYGTASYIKVCGSVYLLQ